MGTTVELICNAALARIGIKDFIEDIEEETTEAAACDALYESQRDLVLASHPWRFATKRATLAVIADVERDGWEYVYALPVDFVELVQIAPENRNPYPTSRTAFATESNAAGNGLMLLTDDPDGNVSYISKAVSPIVYPAHFADALAWLMASELAMPLSVKEELADKCAKRYAIALTQATAKDGGMGFEQEPESEYIRARS